MSRFEALRSRARSRGFAGWRLLFGATIMAFLIVPCIIAIPMSFSGSQFLEFPPSSLSLRWYREFFASREWVDSAVVSLIAGCLCMFLTLVIGTMAAIGVSRLPPRLRAWIAPIYLIPMTVPHVLIATSLFLSFAVVGLNSTITGIVVAHTLIALPVVFITVSAGIAMLDAQQERAARGLGATPLEAFMTVTLPQMRESLVAAGVFAFISSFDETIIVLFITGGRTSTLSRTMFYNMRDEVNPTLAAVASMIVAASLALFLVSSLFRRSTPDAAGRKPTGGTS